MKIKWLAGCGSNPPSPPPPILAKGTTVAPPVTPLGMRIPFVPQCELRPLCQIRLSPHPDPRRRSRLLTPSVRLLLSARTLMSSWCPRTMSVAGRMIPTTRMPQRCCGPTPPPTRSISCLRGRSDPCSFSSGSLAHSPVSLSSECVPCGWGCVQAGRD